MWGWKPTFWEGVVLIFFIIISNIVCFPCFLLQKIGIKAKRHANWLCDVGFDQVTFYAIYSFKKE